MRGAVKNRRDTGTRRKGALAMRGHAAHIWMCAAMVVLALIVVLSTGSLAALLPVVGCVLMMAVMMRIMGGMGGHDDRDRM